jgi:hypothetical protein
LLSLKEFTQGATMRTIHLPLIALLFSCQEPQQLRLDDVDFGSSFRTAVDLNGDGQNELLAASPNGALLIFSEGDSGSFELTQTIEGAGPALTRDVNADGAIDLVLSVDDAIDFNTFESGPAVVMLLNNGSNVFSTFGPFFIEDPSNHIDLADIDGDGLSDIVFLREIRDESNNTVAAEIVTVRNDGFIFGPERTALLIGQEADEIRILSFLVRDFDNDGAADVVAQISLRDNETGPTPERLVIVENDGAGNFIAPAEINLVDNFYTIRAGDIDGDQDIDLVQNFLDEFGVRALFNDGNNQFTARDLGIQTSTFGMFALEDIDQDGAKEILIERGSSARRSELHIVSFSGEELIRSDVGIWHEKDFLLSQIKDLNGDGSIEAIFESNVDEVPDSIVLIYPNAL